MANIIRINSIDTPELSLYRDYKEVQLLHINEPDSGVFIAESPKVIMRALDFGCELLSVLVQDNDVYQYEELMSKGNTESTDSIKEATEVLMRLREDAQVYTAPFDELTKLTGFKLTRGMLAAMRRPKLPSASDILRNSKRIAILEDVENPTNVGAIFRSAAALSMDAILLTPNCTDPLYRRAIRVSMGTVFQIPWTFISKTEEEWHSEGVKLLHENGFKLVAMALKDDSYNINAPELKKEEKLAVILGTEGDGLKNSTIDDCDYTVCIPMTHGVDSLNVAAASAVAFWELGSNK